MELKNSQIHPSPRGEGLLWQEDKEADILFEHDMYEHTFNDDPKIFDRTILSFYVYQVVIKRLLTFDQFMNMIYTYPKQIRTPQTVCIMTNIYRSDTDGDYLDTFDRTQETAVWKVIGGVLPYRQPVHEYLKRIHIAVLKSGLYVI